MEKDWYEEWVVRCEADWCPEYGRTWTITARVFDRLREAPPVFTCTGCQCEPTRIGATIRRNEKKPEVTKITLGGVNLSPEPMTFTAGDGLTGVAKYLADPEDQKAQYDDAVTLKVSRLDQFGECPLPRCTAERELVAQAMTEHANSRRHRTLKEWIARLNRL